jgi:hypothetical protein
MKTSFKNPKHKVGDQVVIRDYGAFGDGHRDITLTITSLSTLSCKDGGKLYRYYGDTTHGPVGAYEDQITERTPLFGVAVDDNQ